MYSIHEESLLNEPFKHISDWGAAADCQPLDQDGFSEWPSGRKIPSKMTSLSLSCHLLGSAHPVYADGGKPLYGPSTDGIVPVQREAGLCCPALRLRENTHTCRVFLSLGPGLIHTKTGVWCLARDLSAWS